MSESATGQARFPAAILLGRICGLTAEQADAAMKTVDNHRNGWKLEVSGPKGKAYLFRYGKDNYTVKPK